MKIYEAGRQTGKTTQLVNWLRTNPDGVLIVHTAIERDRVIKEFTFLNLNPNRVVTLNHVLSGRIRGKYPRPIFAVDNLDLILPMILGGTVGPVTMTPGGAQ